MKNVFKKYIAFKENNESDVQKAEISNKHQLETGFIPNKNLGHIIEAFLKSNEIKLMKDSSNKDGIKLKKKKLYLKGSSVRNLIKGLPIDNYELITDATPTQIGIILSANGFIFKGSEENLKELNFPSHIWNHKDEKVEIAKASNLKDNKTWNIEKLYESDSHCINVYVNNDDYSINSFYKENGEKEDLLYDDALNNHFTMDSLYIELKNPDGQNKNLIDPTNKGILHLKSNTVRFNSKIKEDVVNGKNKEPIIKSIELSLNLEKDELPEEIIKVISLDEFENNFNLKLKLAKCFIKCLSMSNINNNKLIKIYEDIGFLRVLFPNLNNKNIKIPTNHTNVDSDIIIAWILKENDPTEVYKILSLNHWNHSLINLRKIMFLINLNTNKLNLDYISRIPNSKDYSKETKIWFDMNND